MHTPRMDASIRDFLEYWREIPSMRPAVEPIHPNDCGRALELELGEAVVALTEIVADLQFSKVEQHKNLVVLARAVLAKAKGEA